VADTPTRPPSDDSPVDRVDPVVARTQRAKSGVERLRLVHEAWQLLHDRLTASLVAAYPDWSTDQIENEVAKRLGR
jgi:hypothetical protein